MRIFLVELLKSVMVHSESNSQKKYGNVNYTKSNVSWIAQIEHIYSGNDKHELQQFIKKFSRHKHMF